MSPTGSTAPGPTTGGPDPGEGVGGARAEDRGRRRSRRPRRGSCGPPAGRAQGHRRSRPASVTGSPNGLARPSVLTVHGAPVTAHGQGGAGADDQSGEGHLEHRRAGAGRLEPVADHPVGEVGRRSVEGAGPGDAQVRVADPPPVLDRHEAVGALHDEGHVSSRKRTRVPGASSAGGSVAGSQRTASVRPSRRQPPGEPVGYTPHQVSARATDPAGTRGRGVASRGHGERPPEGRRQVGEARREAAERHDVLRRRVGSHRLGERVIPQCRATSSRSGAVVASPGARPPGRPEPGSSRRHWSSSPGRVAGSTPSNSTVRAAGTTSRSAPPGAPDPAGQRLSASPASSTSTSTASVPTGDPHPTSIGGNEVRGPRWYEHQEPLVDRSGDASGRPHRPSDPAAPVTGVDAAGKPAVGSSFRSDPQPRERCW